MADDLYIAAEERARAARRAGLQARKDEQPQNTTRSYASKQREWKVPSLSLPPPPFSLPASLDVCVPSFYIYMLMCAPRTGAVRRVRRRMALCTAGLMASWLRQISLRRG